MHRTVTIFLYFGDLLLFINKEWWKGSAPISCTLLHSKALAHWRHAGLEKLPIPRWLPPVPPDLYSPQEGLPLLVPSVPWDCGIWASPLEAGLELLFQGGYPQYHLQDLYSPQEGPLPGPLLPVILPCHPYFTHIQCIISSCITISGISD